MDRLDLSGEDYLADLASIFAYDEPQSRDQPAFPKEIHLKRPNSKRKARSGAASSAARSKRYRERKANELQEVVAEQQWLKRERSDLLAKLALLQQEVQALRGRSVVDFERENRLLRAEIAGHKHFVNRILELNRLASSALVDRAKMTNIEKAAESACGHLVGLYLSSGNAYCGATGWRSPKPLDLLPDVVSSYSYQLLPLDCKPDLVQRINLRYDHIIPCNRRDVAQFLWESGTDVEVMKKRQTVKEKLENFKVDKVSPSFKGKESRLSCLQLRSIDSEDEGGLSRLFVLKEKTAKLNISRLLPLKQCERTTLREARVLAVSSVDESHHREKMTEQPLLQGWIISDCGENRCLFSEIGSFKLVKADSTESWGLKLSHVLNADNSLSNLGVHSLRAQVSEVLEHCRKDSGTRND